uniref:NR LBD domain-containing protein n=1 Tax=Heterorhabditis bacteriophora TaxID=37862 RepID=A0A1I7WAQ0_HETBA
MRKWIDNFITFNFTASTGDFGENMHLSSSPTSDINGLSSSPPEIQLSNDESDDFNIEGVSTISFGEKNTLISSNDEIRAIPSPSISSPLKPPIYNSCSLSVIGTHSTGALYMASTPDASVEEPSLFKNTCISICNEKEAQIDFDVPSCSVAEDNVEPSNLTVPEVQHLPVLGMPKDQCFTNDLSKQQSLLGNILWSNPNNSDRIQMMTLKQKVVQNNYVRRVKSSSEMNQDTFQQDSEKQSFMSTEPRTVIAHKPRVSVFDITLNVTRNVESVYQRIDKAMEHCDSCESRYTRLLLRLIADKQEVRQQIGKVNSSLHQIFVNVVWNEFCSYVLTDDVVKQSGLSEEEDSRIDTNDLPTGVALRLVLEYRILSTLNNMGILQSLMGLDGFELLDDVPMLLGKGLANFVLSHSTK